MLDTTFNDAKRKQNVARHRIDLGKNTDSPVKLTPEHNRPVFSPNAVTPIH